MFHYLRPYCINKIYYQNFNFSVALLLNYTDILTPSLSIYVIQQMCTHEIDNHMLLEYI